MTRIRDCIQAGDKTILLLDGTAPVKGWRKLYIDGEDYEPIPVMDATVSCVAVDGKQDLSGKEVAFK